MARCRREVAELEGFAQGLSKDYEAVKAALTHEWSNAQVEGQISRPKFIERQMYGRANLDLLKACFLHATSNAHRIDEDRCPRFIEIDTAGESSGADAQ